MEGIEHNGYKTSLVEYREERQIIYKKGMQKGRRRKVEESFLFLTNLSISRKNVPGLVEYGRMRWKIENEGFNTQKRQGYHLEHQFSRDYQAQKCHYYLIQIGHMTAQVLEAWEKLWKNVKQSREQKHRRLLESFKNDRLKDLEKELEKKFQVRFI